MNKLTTLLLGCLMSFSLLASAAPSEADQKWLQAVQKMVVHGEKKLSTSSEDRMSLFKEWAQKNGYSVSVTKSEKSYSLEVAAKGAATGIAQN